MIMPWTFESSDDEVDLSEYSIRYELESQDGETVPDWIDLIAEVIIA